MDSLPLEIKTTICSYLDHCGLLGFSSASKHCNQAARFILFSRLHIRLISLEDLPVRINGVLDAVKRASSLQHVRCLEIVAADVHPPSGLLRANCGDRPQDIWQYYAPYANSALTLDHDSDWLPLAQMMDQFPGLRRFTWACQQQIPPCVLRALASKPDCQLDISSFSLRSLFRPPGDPLGIDAHELALATSRALSSLCLRFDMRDEGFSNYNYYAVMDMAAGAAPNLRRVALLYESSGSSPALLATRGIRSQPWRHDIIPRSPGTTLGQLHCLELCVGDTGDALREWSTKIGFLALRVLKLYSSVDANTLRWLANECRWSKLHTLVITPGEDVDSALGDLYSATQAFLKSIPPLQSLRLSRHYDRATLETALKTHGSTLRQLLLTGKRKTWLVSIDIVDLIHRYCPMLEELYIPVARSAGSAQEVAIYRALGRMPAIKKLHLTFHQTNVYLPIAFNPQDQGHANDDDIRIALMNYAVDEQLAKAIFAVISRSKCLDVPPLEYLELRAEEKLISQYRGYPWELDRVFEYLRRSWICERPERDDCLDHECVALEPDQEEILDRQDCEEDGEYDFLLDPDVEPIFRSIWPGHGPWKDEWQSLPLETT